jgi:acyl carrier protein
MDGLLEILQGLFPDVDVETCDTLVDDKIFDSFAIIQFVGEVADKLDITIPAEEIVPDNFNSYRALSELLAKLEDE